MGVVSIEIKLTLVLWRYSRVALDWGTDRGRRAVK